MGNSRKNELYIAKHIPFFQTQIEYEVRQQATSVPESHLRLNEAKIKENILEFVSCLFYFLKFFWRFQIQDKQKLVQNFRYHC